MDGALPVTDLVERQLDIHACGLANVDVPAVVGEHGERRHRGRTPERVDHHVQRACGGFLELVREPLSRERDRSVGTQLERPRQALAAAARGDYPAGAPRPCELDRGLPDGARGRQDQHALAAPDRRAVDRKRGRDPHDAERRRVGVVHRVGQLDQRVLLDRRELCKRAVAAEARQRRRLEAHARAGRQPVGLDDAPGALHSGHVGRLRAPGEAARRDADLDRVERRRGDLD